MKIERRSKRYELHPKTFNSGPLTQSINTQHVQVRNRHPLPLAVTLIGNHALALQILKVTTKAPTIRPYSLYGTKRNYIHLRAWCCGHNLQFSATQEKVQHLEPPGTFTQRTTPTATWNHTLFWEETGFTNYRMEQGST